MGNKVVCVLGMGRSGTSALTRVLNLLGVYIGGEEDLMSPAPENPDGFWEHNKIVEIHDQILRLFSSDWFSTNVLPNNWRENPQIDVYKDKLKNVLHQEFAERKIWGFKDPRTCILLPLWKEIFDELELDPFFIVSVRNPIDVAESLRKRDNLDMGHSFRLWAYHNCNILYYTKDSKNKVILYDDLIEKSKSVIQSVINFLDIQVDEIQMENAIASIKGYYRHSQTKDLEKTDPFLKDLWQNILLYSQSVEEKLEGIDTLFSNYYNWRKFIDLREHILVKYPVSIYLDNGQGYNAQDRITKYFFSTGRIKVNYSEELKPYADIKVLRFDPIEGFPCKAKILDIKTDAVITSIIPINSNSNPDGFDEFFNTDPIYELKGDFGGFEYFEIEFEIEIITYEALLIKLEEQLTINKQIIEFEEIASKANEKVQNLVLQIEQEKIKYNELEAVLKQINRERTKQFEEQQIKYHALENHLEKVEDSIYWRMTKPLRRLFSYKEER